MSQSSSHVVILAFLVPSSTTSFKVFSTCFLCFLETFLKKVTNCITWTLPLLWFTKSKVLLCRAKLQLRDYHQHLPPHFRAVQVPSYAWHHRELLLYTHIFPQAALQGEMAKCDFSKIVPHWMLCVKDLILTQNAHLDSFDCQVAKLLQLQHAGVVIGTDSQFTKLNKP